MRLDKKVLSLIEKVNKNYCEIIARIISYDLKGCMEGGFYEIMSTRKEVLSRVIVSEATDF
jgi:hypothetical protein